MKKAWIIVNHFLTTSKFTGLYDYFKNSAKKNNIELKMYTNEEIIKLIYSKVKFPDFIIFWDKDIRLARLLESEGARLFNCASAIEAADDKFSTYLLLKSAGIPTPETIPAPMTFSNIEYTDYEFVRRAGERLGYPMIVKEVFGSFGQQVYLAEDSEEAENAVKKAQRRPVIFQKYIAQSRGRDVRINVVGRNAVACMERYSENDFRSNLTLGGNMRSFNPDSETVKTAIDACAALSLDFAGVDILFGENNRPIVCEVNSNAHFKTIYECTGINFADEIIKYIGKLL